MEAVARGELEAIAHMALGVQVDEALLVGGEAVAVGEVDRARIDHGPFQEALHRELLDRLEALGRGHRAGRVGAAHDRQRRIDDHVLPLADALDDPPVGLGIVALAAGALVIGVEVDDRGPCLGAGDPVRDQLADRDRHGGLQGPPPRPVQRHLQPDRSVRHPRALQPISHPRSSGRSSDRHAMASTARASLRGSINVSGSIGDGRKPQRW